MRVVSLFPSATEIVAELGVDPAAVSHQCDYPPHVGDRPTLTGLVRSLDEDPADVDRIVAHDDVYYLDGDVLAAADPDVVLTQGVCAVCALDASLAHEAVDRLDLDAEILDVHADTLADVFDNVERIGAAVNEESTAADLVAELRERVARVEERVSDLDDRPRVAALDWVDPLRTAGLWVPELVELAGGDPLLAEPGERSGKVDWADLRALDPEVVVAAPCGYDVDDAARALEQFADRPGFAETSAASDGRVYAMDGAAYMNRHSHRVVDTLERLARIVHPDAFDDPPSDGVRGWQPA